MNNSRENLNKTLNHEEPEKIVFDLGGTVVSGISANTLYRLRKKLGLEDKPVKLYEPFQCLGLIEEDVQRMIGADIIGIRALYNSFGFRNDNWKTWEMPDKTEVLVGGGFSIKETEEAYYYYPCNDYKCSPSAKMPKRGYYFDPIERQEPLEGKLLDGKIDYKDDFKLFSDEELKYFEKQAKELFENTDYGIIGPMEFFPAGDIGLIFGVNLQQPKGVRRLEEWLISHYSRPEYIKEILECGCEVAIKNLQLFKEAVGDRVQVVPVSGSDLGGQDSLLFSPDIYREIYKPFHKKVNSWVHKNTKWKVFFHSCGSIVKLLDDFIDAGVDIINPVQCSAKDMDPSVLKKKYGKNLVFWGGAVDPHMLQFENPEAVYNQTKERIKIFSECGGFVCAAVHNIQPNVPIYNLIAFIEAVENCKRMK